MIDFNLHTLNGTETYKYWKQETIYLTVSVPEC